MAATGNNQATSNAVSGTLACVTSSTAGSGVVLPNAAVGRTVTLINDTANAIIVYVMVSSILNGVTNGTLTLSANSSVDFVSTSSTKWFAKTGVYS